MTIFCDKLVIAPEVELISAEHLDEADIGDKLIERRNQRQSTRLISQSVADLLERFRTPASLPEVIAALSKDIKEDPDALLEQAMPIVSDLVEGQILQKSEHVNTVTRRFVEGAEIAGFTVHKTLRGTVDTEVALAFADDGTLVALKTLHPSASDVARDMFTQEIEVSKRASRSVGPTVRGLIADHSAPVLVLDWYDGLPLNDYVATACKDWRDRLTVCTNVASAFAKLHAIGVLHGDIRSSNILIDESGKVRILDFGMSQWVDRTPLRKSFELTTLEPEAALAFLNDDLAGLSVKGEVFTLALVLAEAICADPVRHLPALVEDALTAVAHEPVEILTGLYGLDDVLSNATNAIESRLPDMRAFAASLAAVACPQEGSVFKAPRSTPANLAVDQALAELCRAEHFADSDALASAAFQLRCARSHGYPSADNADPLHTPVAIALLNARCAYAQRDFKSARLAWQTISTETALPDAQSDLFSGHAGELALLAQFVADYAIVDAELAQLFPALEKRYATVLDNLARLLDDLACGRPLNLGMAHGLAGVTFAALRAQSALNMPTADQVQDSLACLARERCQLGPGLAWPGTLNAKSSSARVADYAPGWCNGAAGMLLLWMAAKEVTGSNAFDTIMEGCAAYAYAHPDKTPNLCCGLAGRGLALTRYAKFTGNQTWQTAAQALVQQSIAKNDKQNSGSMFRGQLGIEIASQELLGHPASCLPF